MKKTMELLQDIMKIKGLVQIKVKGLIYWNGI